MNRKVRRQRTAGGVGVAAAALEWGRGSKVILVPLDGSVEAKAALPVARLISNLMGTAIRVLYVGEEQLDRTELLQRLKLTAEDSAGLIIDQVTGAPVDEIVRCAAEEQAMLVIMTTRGHTAYEGRSLRPIPELVAQKVSCPVILVRPENGPRIARMKALRRILLPLDGAPCMMEVVAPAVILAEKSRAELDVLYVASLYEATVEQAGKFTIPRYVDQPQYEWPVWVQQCLDRIGAYVGAPLEAPAHVFVGRGEPWDEILRLAAQRDSDLIALEWHGHFDATRAAVVKAVLAESPCPVILLRSPTDKHDV